MQKSPVSVIIPAYNRADYIAETIESVLTQSLPPLEIIVVNDGSTDTTPDVLACFGDRVTVIHQANQGISSARNAGLACAQGSYVAFLDSDDLYLPHLLKRLSGYLDGHPEIGLVAGLPYFIRDRDSASRYLPEDVGHGVGPCFPEPDRLAVALLRGNLFFVPCVMVRRAAIAALPEPFFDPKLSALADWDLWLRLVLNGTRVGRIDERVALYREHSGNMRVTQFDTFQRDHNRIVAKVVGNNLDGWLPARPRQNYRVRNLQAAVQFGAVRPIVRSLSGTLFPDHRPSLYGFLLLAALAVRFVQRQVKARMAHVLRKIGR